ncbi:MAG TPA: hypothetical protein PKH02_11310 [Bacteroidales bacterium]|nr:hypothetical protein [Bacteroidales bacterium]HPT21989.1 hypothetical protein [Bacteroidales bacterium]
MIKTALIALTLSLFTLSLDAQVFIGVSKNDVLAEMRKKNPGFINDSSVHNDRYNYLKYISDDESETWIIVFDSKNKCIGVRVICDIGKINVKRKELDALYTKRGKDKWSLDQHTGNILVDLKNETWYFTITYRQEPKL